MALRQKKVIYLGSKIYTVFTRVRFCSSVILAWSNAGKVEMESVSTKIQVNVLSR